MKQRPPAWAVVTAADRIALDHCYWDDTEFNQFKRFAGEFCIQTQGQWNGQPIELFDYQDRIFAPLLSWKKANGNPRFNLGAVYSCKKIGKTSSLAALASFDLTTKRDQQIFIISAKVEQARIMFDTIKGFARHPSLAKRWHIKDHRNEIIDRVTNSRVKILACNPSISGFSADKIYLDELSEFPRHAAQIIWDRILFAGASKPNSQIVAITTPAHSLDHLSYRLWQRCQRLLNGDDTDDLATMPVCIGVPVDEDWESESVWLKHLPHIGKTVSLDFYRTQYRRAKGQPHEEMAFRIYLLGQWIRNRQSFIQMTDYKNCIGTLEEPSKQPAAIGLDYGASHDICGISVLVPREDGKVMVYPRAAITRQALIRKVKVGRTEYQAWADAGSLFIADTETITLEQLKRWLELDYEQFDIKALAYDPYHLTELQQDYESMGRLVIETPPWGRFMGSLVSDFEKRMRERTFVFDDNPIMEFCVENLRVKEDKYGRLLPDRENDRAKIDLAVSTIIGLNSLPEAMNPTPVWELPSVLSLAV